jgi:hypothetical protein
MSIKRRTETKPIERDIDLAPDPDDDERTQALSRGLLTPTLEFDGMELHPFSAGTHDLLQVVSLRLLAGDTSRVLHDIGAFILVHADETRKDARRAIYQNPDDFEDMVFEFLDQPGMMKKLTEFQPTLIQMMEDFQKTETISMGTGTAGAGKKSGHRIG